MNRVGIIVQARTGSTRLPGKVLLPVMGRPVLAYQLERLMRVRADAYVVATTCEPADDAIVALALDEGWSVWRGPTNDVLQRYIDAATACDVRTVVRSTGDCPLIDPAIVERLVDRYRHGIAAHVQTGNAPLSGGIPDGMGAEVCARSLLREIRRLDPTPEEREHVTLYLRRRPETYALEVLDFPEHDGLEHERWTLDTAADFELIRRVLEALWPANPAFTLSDVARLLDEHPDWRALNADVPPGPIDVELARVRDFAPARGDL